MYYYYFFDAVRCNFVERYVSHFEGNNAHSIFYDNTSPIDAIETETRMNCSLFGKSCMMRHKQNTS